MIDLTFPGDVLQKLTPDLAALGFIISEETVSDRLSWSVATRMTALRRDLDLVYLIHLKRDVIDADRPKVADLRAMAFLEYCLPEAGSLVIMSENLDALASPVERIIDAWKERRINVCFIPWRRINELPPEGVGARLLVLAELLGVMTSSSHPAGASPKKIERADEQEIIRIMTNLAVTDMGGPEHFFKNLVERTRLTPDMQSKALMGWKDGSTLPGDYARGLMLWAIARGRFTPEDGSASRTVLGEIIRKLAEECGDDDRARLGSIAVRYQLLDDLAIRRLGMSN